ncbi:unnamed protein product [Medioppia subpectinata]|uniref:T-cell immunomodulatory protein TIP C2 domain-containing protein n=1 Tax=Medioppia subpectinata TaxID=1979941 RepID=A0A7R9KW71_9ACAR|nr:unnamed protein product [Medioppia subpectinata]CAG2110630.1 unnamed protein product [Medioppia subpectinata]
MHNKWIIIITIIYLVPYLRCDSIGQKLFGNRQDFPGLEGVLGAFTDFNYDRITDVLLITESGRSVEVVDGGIDEEPYLSRRSDIKCTFADESGDRIVGIVAADFTGNSYSDVLAVTQNVHKLPTDKSFKLWLFRVNGTHILCNTTVPLVESIKSFPLVLDYNGDMIADFIVESDDCRKELWTSLWPSLWPQCLHSMHTNQLMAYPNGNAFIDLSAPKDFAADVYITGAHTMEYWFHTPGQGFTAQNSVNISYPNRDVYTVWGQSTFADIDFDGVIEHMLPVCKGGDIDACDEPQILVLSRNGSDYHWVEALDEEDSHELGLTFTQRQLFGYLDLFVTLRAGDMDSDGYPDVVTAMLDRNTSQTRAVWLQNSATDPQDSIGYRGRKFRIQWVSSEEDSSDDESIHLVTIFDFNEDGNLDILVNTHNANHSDIRLRAYENSGQLSENFLKVLVTSGICSGDECPHIRAPLVGPHVCFSPSEGKQVGCGGQMCQTAHSALQLPFVLFGLGDIPNFIENITVSIPSGPLPAAPRRQTWYELIPDSNLIIIPYPANDTANWVQKLYLDPKYFAFQTMITLTSLCCLLVVIIAILHKRELKQDIIDQREYRRHWL